MSQKEEYHLSKFTSASSSGYVDTDAAQLELSTLLAKTLFSLRFPELLKHEEDGNFDAIQRAITLDQQTQVQDILRHYNSKDMRDLILSPEVPADDSLGGFVLSLEPDSIVHSGHAVSSDRPFGVKLLVDIGAVSLEPGYIREHFSKSIISLINTLTKVAPPSIAEHFAESTLGSSKDKAAWGTYLPKNSHFGIYFHNERYYMKLETHAGISLGRELARIVDAESMSARQFALDPRTLWVKKVSTRNARRVLHMIAELCGFTIIHTLDTRAYVPKHTLTPKMCMHAHLSEFNTFRLHSGDSKYVSFYHNCIDAYQSFGKSLLLKGDVLKGVQVVPLRDKHVLGFNTHGMFPMGLPLQKKTLKKKRTKKIRKVSRAQGKESSHMVVKDQYDRSVFSVFGVPPPQSPEYLKPKFVLDI